MQRLVKRTSDFQTGQSGLGVFTKLSPTTARVDFDGVGADGKPLQFPLTIIVAGETKNIPDYFKFTKMAVNGKIMVKITLTEKNDGIAFLSPATSQERAKFLWFSGGEESVPVSKIKPGNDQWGKPNKPSMWAVLEVTEGKWTGCRVSAYLTYLFGQDDKGVYIFSGKQGEKLAEFMDAVGVDCETLKPSENLLPEIQKLAQEKDKEFSILIQDGWVNQFIADFSADEAWADDGEEEVGFTEAPAKVEEKVHPALADDDGLEF